MSQAKLALFLLGCLTLLLALVVEVGLGSSLPSASGGLADAATPGIGIRYLATIDIALFYTLTLMALEFIAPRAILGRVQGVVTLILSIIGILAVIVLVILAITALMLMVSLLLAPPFGTLAYFAAWGTFPSGTARGTLALIMFLKIASVLLLIFASPAFLKNKGLVVLIAFSLLATFLNGFLIAFVPSFLASITDALSAIISGVLGAIWMLVMLIGAIFAVIRMLRSVVPG
jgi:hypothetical protein